MFFDKQLKTLSGASHTDRSCTNFDPIANDAVRSFAHR